MSLLELQRLEATVEETALANSLLSVNCGSTSLG